MRHSICMILAVILFQQQYATQDKCTDVAYQMASKMSTELENCVWMGEYYNQLSCNLISDSSMPIMITFSCSDTGKLTITR